MLPRVNERLFHDTYYAHDERRDWRDGPRGPASATGYHDATNAGPSVALPPLRATLSYREDFGWPDRAATMPSTLASGPQSNVCARLDNLEHLPLRDSSAQLLRSDSIFDDEEDDWSYPHHGEVANHHSQAYHHDAVSHPDPQYRRGALTAVSTMATTKRSRRLSNSERGKRYRSRRKEYVATLETQVEALQQQLKAMQMQPGSRVVAIAPDRSRAGLARIVCDYFSLVHFGVPVPPEMRGGHRQLEMDSPAQQRRVVQSAPLQDFVLSLMDPNLRFGDSYGVHVLLEQWQRYSAYHSALEFDLHTIQVLPGETTPVVHATATLRVRFSRTTIERVFPHVLWDEALVQRLIGRVVEYPVDSKFHFGVDNKIQWLDAVVDFTNAFVKALGNTRDAMQLVGSALITEQNHIADEGDVMDGHARSPMVSSSSSRSSRHSVLNSAEASMPPLVEEFTSRRPREVVDESRSRVVASRFTSEPRTRQASLNDDPLYVYL